MSSAEHKHITKWIGIISIIVIISALVISIIVRFVPEYPVRYDKIEEHFKYGSIGSEPENGLPYWIWKVLPEMFPEKLPGKGYESLGFIYEEGRDLPIGVSKRTVNGVDRVWLNCAVCHTSTVRETPEAERSIIMGMPANGMQLYKFIIFLTNAAMDNRFTPELMMEKIEEIGGDLNILERLIYKIAVKRTRTALLELRNQLSFLERQQDWGSGRVDTFNPYKAIQFNFPMEKLPQAELVGPADYPSIWHQRPREGMQLHWDGNNDSVNERNRSAALGAGVTPVTLDRNSIARLQEWLLDFKPPPYPKLNQIDKDKAMQGKNLYKQYCANCHGMKEGNEYDFDRKRFPLLGEVEPITRIRTDPGRLNSYTEILSLNQSLLYAGYPEDRFSHFRKTNGYANMPLDGIWLRAPYLHNGSVPTLRDLLNPAHERPKVFYRGNDVYDWKKVGFVSDIAKEKDHSYFRFDTSEAGNSNAGHEGEAYGTYLPADKKDAIVEYMKTF